MGDKYEELTAMLWELEPKAKRSDATVVDISQLLSTRQKQQKASYAAAVSLISSFQVGHPKAKPQEQQIPKAANQTFLHIGLQKSARYEQELAKQAGSAKTELQGIVSRLVAPVAKAAANRAAKAPAGIGIRRRVRYAVRRLEISGARQIEVMRVREGDLVLPKLAVVDQIGELEKIITGLKEAAFDREQAEVVSEELYGLAKALKGRRGQPVISESNLLNLRNERLREAVKGLEDFLVRSGR